MERKQKKGLTIKAKIDKRIYKKGKRFLMKNSKNKSRIWYSFKIEL